MYICTKEVKIASVLNYIFIYHDLTGIHSRAVVCRLFRKPVILLQKMVS